MIGPCFAAVDLEGSYYGILLSLDFHLVLSLSMMFMKNFKCLTRREHCADTGELSPPEKLRGFPTTVGFLPLVDAADV